MIKDKYVRLLNQIEISRRVICGFNQDRYGEAIVTTGVPREYNEGQVTYVRKKKMTYDDYIMSELYGQSKKRR